MGAYIYVSHDDLQSYERVGNAPPFYGNAENYVITIDMAGILHIVAVEVPPVNSINYQCKLYYSYSFNDGYDWKYEDDNYVLHYSDGDIDDAKVHHVPSIICDPMGNLAILYYTDDDKYKILRSYDSGITWQAPVEIEF